MQLEDYIATCYSKKFDYIVMDEETKAKMDLTTIYQDHNFTRKQKMNSSKISKPVFTGQIDAISYRDYNCLVFFWSDFTKTHY